MIHPRKLGKLSSTFFLLGFIISKIQYLPVTIVSSFFHIIALGCYFLAYGAWFISSHFQPNQENNTEEWYGFAQFKEQFLYAATMGLIASLISILAIFFPVLIVPASWLFFSSNIFWTIGEYNKLQNPPESDENYSHSYQSTYLAYAMTMAATGLTTALSTTLVFIFPAITVPIIITATIISTGLGVLATEYWLDYTFGDHKKTPLSPHSYNYMNKSLGNIQTQQTVQSPQPYHGAELLKCARIKTVQNEESKVDIDLSNQAFTPRQ
ncbi:hypothetical protein [uncultured Legionella sp.]|uniref:hypothetical protein n=1 Tax=uncultured Legionella sp. TaxID=210934 RepID=UPI00262AD676|nr:hypothetical protein [uncultured Legionella sp.]